MHLTDRGRILLAGQALHYAAMLLHGMPNAETALYLIKWALGGVNNLLSGDNWSVAETVIMAIVVDAILETIKERGNAKAAFALARHRVAEIVASFPVAAKTPLTVDENQFAKLFETIKEGLIENEKKPAK